MTMIGVSIGIGNSRRRTGIGNPAARALQAVLSSTGSMFQGWDDDGAATVVTAADTAAVQSSYNSWASTADFATDRLIIELDWDGPDAADTSIVLDGPVAASIGSDPSQFGGYEALVGGVTLRPAAGRAPIIAGLLNCKGIPRVHLDRIGLSGSALAGGTTYCFRSDRVLATPYPSRIAMTGVTFGLGQEAIEQDVALRSHSMTGQAYSLFVRDSLFESVMGAITMRVRVLHSKDNFVRDQNNGDVHNNYGVINTDDFAAEWADQYCDSLVEGMVLVYAAPDNSNGVHPDFFQVVTPNEMRLGTRTVIRQNLVYIGCAGVGSASQFYFGKDVATGNGQLERHDAVIEDNIAFITAYNAINFADQSGVGSLSAQRNTFGRTGVYSSSNAHPWITLGDNLLGHPDMTYARAGGRITVTGNICANDNIDTADIATGKYTIEDFTFVDPRDGVGPGGDGSTEALAYRPEEYWPAVAGTAVRDVSDILTYRVPYEELWRDRAQAFYGLREFFTPGVGWVHDPADWDRAPAVPETTVTNGGYFVAPATPPANKNVARIEAKVTFHSSTDLYDYVFVQGLVTMSVRIRTGVDVRLSAKDSSSSTVLSLTQVGSVPAAPCTVTFVAEFDYLNQEVRFILNDEDLGPIPFTGVPATPYVRSNQKMGFMTADLTALVDGPPADTEIHYLRVFLDNEPYVDISGDATAHPWWVPPPAVPAMLLSVGGQSNARKAGNSGGTPDAKYSGSLGDTYIWNDATSSFISYVVGSASGHRGGLDSGVWGSEAEFVYQLRQDGDTRPIYIVKEAVNGNALAVVGGGDWSPDSAGERYDGYVAQAVAAKAALTTAGFTDIEEVFLWNQGEADSTDDTNAAAYAANLTYLLSNLASDGAFSATGKFIIERIRPCTSDLENSSYTRQFLVREAQESLAASVSRISIISQDFDPTNFNSLHPVEPWTMGVGLRAWAAYDGSYDATYGAVSDDVPTMFTFTDQTDVTPGAVIASNQLTLAGLGGHSDVTITGGEYRVLNPDDTDWQAWTSAPGTIHPGQKLQVRVTASASTSTAASATVTVGGVSDTFTVTTYAAAPSYEAETTAFIAQVASNGGGTIAGADADALDEFFVAAKATSWWAKMGRLYLRLGDEVASRLDLVGQTDSLYDAGLGPTTYWAWAAADGWSGLDTANGGLGMNVDLATDWSQNSGAYGCWYSALATNTRGDMTSPSGTTYHRFLNTGATRYLLNSAANKNGSALSTTLGMRAIVRDGASSIRMHGADGAQIDSGTVASLAQTSEELYIGNPSGIYSDASILGAFFASEALSAVELASIATIAGTLQDYFSPGMGAAAFTYGGEAFTYEGLPFTYGA